MTISVDISCMEYAVNKKSNIRTTDLKNSDDPYFNLELNKNRNLATDINPSHVYSRFEHALRHNPKDLACHLQRIQFSIEQGSQNQLFAALCDLFITLGSNGLPLRQRLLVSYKPLLNQEQAEILNSSISKNSLRSDYPALPNHCYFKKPTITLLDLNEISDNEKDSKTDAISIANFYIENSQFDTAIEYIQSFIDKQPDNEALTIKLLALYKALSYTDEFHSVYEKYSKHPETSRYWQETKQYFLKEKIKKMSRHFKKT